MSILAIAINPTIDFSSTVKRVYPTKKIRTHHEKRHAGGGGVNVARVASELGAKVHLLCTAGGLTGALLSETLTALDFGLTIIPIEGMTRLAYMVREDETGLEFRFVPEGPDLSQPELDRILGFVEEWRGDYVVASGSLPPNVPLDFYARIGAIANRNGARFIVDTSGPALAATINATKVFLFKPSLEEMEELVGHRLDEKGLRAAATDMIRAGKAEIIAITLGKEGALVVNAAGIDRIAAPHVVVRSAVGAGDSFIGAMITALEQGMPIGDAARMGVAAGAATATTFGTELCHRADVLAIYETIRHHA